MEELKKIDMIRERMKVSYQQAKEALDQNDGDVVQTLIQMENKKGYKAKEHKLEDKVNQLSEHMRDIIKKGNVTKVRLKKEDRVVFEVSATVGVLGLGGAILIPPLAIIGVVGTVAALINHYRLEIVYDDGKVEERGLDFLVKDDETKEH
jgi:N-acetylmuramic acid 6-phosphate (MurNAc-6-P) etherase